MNAAKLDVLCSLRNNVEGNNENGWKMVYLDNARPKDMNDKQFRGCLAALSKMGVYKVVDGYAWGKVKVG